MTDYTISFKLSNETVYACYRGRFWRWDGSFWKESHLMTQKFERAKAADKHLTPQAFLTNGAEFAPLDEYEIDCAMLDALENAKPCKNAPIEPMKEESECQTSTPATSLQNCESVPAASAGGSSAPMPSAPGFDFSALGDLSEQAVETDQQFDLHYGTAQDEYLISCIYVAKMHALTAKAGRYGGGTWTKWYESKGMSEGSARTMTQNGDAFKSATVADLKLLPSISRKDLNLIARSGCGELFGAAAGDSQRVQELLAQLKAKEYKLNETQARLKSACIQEQESRDAMNTANAQLEAANADIKGLTEQNDQLRNRLDAAEAREEEAWKMQSKAEARAKNAEDALKKQPIVGVTDPEEVRQQADALAAEAKAQARRQIEDAQRRTREAEARYQKLQQDADGFLAPEQSCAQQAKIIADSMRSMYLGWFGLASTTGTPLARMAAPIYQVCDEIRESLEEDTTINPTAEGSVEDAEREALFE